MTQQQVLAYALQFLLAALLVVCLFTDRWTAGAGMAIALSLTLRIERA